jgi:hypothetical protein
MGTKLNATWHQQHPMPSKPTLDQRVRWHVAHAKVCACREVPATVVAELKRRGLPIPAHRKTSS